MLVFVGPLLLYPVLGAAGAAPGSSSSCRGVLLTASCPTAGCCAWMGAVLQALAGVTQLLPELTVGLIATLTTVACIIAADTGAYFVGKNLGRTKLTDISPKKTVEGALGGLASAVAVAVLFWKLFSWPGNALAAAGYGVSCRPRGLVGGQASVGCHCDAACMGTCAGWVAVVGTEQGPTASMCVSTEPSAVGWGVSVRVQCPHECRHWSAMFAAPASQSQLRAMCGAAAAGADLHQQPVW